MVRRLSDIELRDLMRDLLLAEAYRSGADVSKVITEIEAADEGADALTPAGVTHHAWLADVPTCWQLKAGRAGQSSKLVGEVTKPLAALTLKSGGRLVLVASGAVAGGSGTAARRQAVVDDAVRAGLPTSRLEVMTSEALTSWINQHPALAASLRGMPPGYSSLGHWIDDPAFRDPWVGSTALDTKLDELRRAIDFNNPTPAVHLHVYGTPGVGRTRFVLQACTTASWSKMVLYAPRWADANIAGMLAAASEAPNARLVLVVDDVPAEQVKTLASRALAAPDRLRVISIGHHESPDSQTIAQLEVQALDGETMAKLIAAAHPTMPTEHAQSVVSFADGSASLAKQVASAIAP